MAKKKPAKKHAGGRPPKFTDAQLREQIDLTSGMITTIAERLKVTPQAIYKRLDADPELRKYQQAAKRLMVDTAQAWLAKAVMAGNLKACQFVIRYLGKSEGYGLSMEVKSDAAGKIVFMVPDDGRDSPDFGK